MGGGVARPFLQSAAAADQLYRAEVGRGQQWQGGGPGDQPGAIGAVAQFRRAGDGAGARSGEKLGALPGQGDDLGPGSGLDDRAQQVEDAGLMGLEQRPGGLVAESRPVGQVVSQQEQ